MLKLEATKNFISFYVVKDVLGEPKLVYCRKCGMLNPDNAANCSNCGAPLYTADAENRSYSRRDYHHRHYEDKHDQHQRGGGGYGLLIGGMVLIIIALVLLLSPSFFSLYFWPVILVIVGVALVVRAVILNRRYRQQSPH